MKSKIVLYSLFALIFLGINACDESQDDVLPKDFYMIQVNPDDIYMYNSGSALGVRLDPLLNDSIKVDVSISYSVPLHGEINFIQNEGWFYRPDPGFFGIDNIIYTVCYLDDCLEASITMIVEEPIDPANCTFEVNGESVEVEKDQAIAIRIFENDMPCGSYGFGMWAPEKGAFTTFSYSGSYKNTVYVYYPPKGYTGTDRFKYRMYNADGGFEDVYCNITIK